ncbi:histidine phosphatase family protein [Allosphingosinicella flava]|uniref:Histidine phosphatase family protein n=1 Tax=Allosphingosinicella flava TaxID=2771430 RepID=A0A7T2LLD2_9SPHN|nr:histidine phosphatase family protein [Sphingosinicella flava]QPQ54309.1 histidine phosphatase family protein [Sphingosinicella flava]
MKILTLLRHAKSTWDDPVARDFDRPLNRRGRRAAQTVGRAMRAEKLIFDAVRASPALRVVETLADIETGYGRALSPDYDQRLYLAAAETLLDIVRETDDGVERLMIVGHNPGLERLALMLAGPGALREEAAVKYPTATIAEIRFDVAHWADVAEGEGTIARFIRPRDLDPELGPDEDSY